MFRVQKDEYNTGFQMVFENGWTVSVQFGKLNYCSNRTYTSGKEIFFQSPDAEIAAWDENGVWYRFENDTVKGWCKPDEVADFIAKVKAF
jgi:hypothetical protein